MFDKLKEKLFKTHEEEAPQTKISFKQSSDDLIDDRDLNQKYVNVEEYVTPYNVGLSEEQVQKRKNDGWINVVKNKYSKSYANIIFGNLCTFFNLLCLICTVALIAVDAKLSDMFFVLIFSANLIIGIIQEIRSKKTVEKLSLVKAPYAIAVRNGYETEVPISDLVLSDVVKLETGNQIPADGIVIEGIVEVNESLLTGESVSIKKTVGDKLYAGSFISSGTTYMRILRVGEDSYVQKLASKAKKFQKTPSKLMSAMTTIIKTIGLCIIPIASLMAYINYRQISSNPMYDGLTEIIQAVVLKTSTVVIGLIPSGMFLLTSMALAVGVIRLAKHKTLTQDMYSLEMLARVDVLCLDKTGTITDGRMSVHGHEFLTEWKLPIESIIGSMNYILQDNNQTAIALKDKYGINAQLVPQNLLNFSSARKYSAVEFKDEGTYVLGAPEFVISNLSSQTTKKIKSHTLKGQRVLLLGHSFAPLTEDGAPKDCVPVALIYIEDNIRQDAITTIKWFKDNDVQIKIISGDDPVTVAEIAKRAGVNGAENYISLEGLNEQEIFNISDKYTVFGRVTPDQKALLVRSLKMRGHTVGMTGDGVNDILAMKESDCSITVASGSDATRSIAHLILMDNNFNSMPKVVHEGRRVVNNIQASSSLYLMKTLFTAIFAIISIISVNEYPYTPRMMTMLEIFIIGVPSFALSMLPNTKRVSGDFTSTVFSNALPGALILVFNVYAMQIITGYLNMEVSTSLATTMNVLVLTYGGLVFLYHVCYPYNVYKSILFIAMFVVTTIWAVFLLDTSYFQMQSIMPIKDNWQYILIIVCLIQFDFPLEKFLLYLSAKTRKDNLKL